MAIAEVLGNKSETHVKTFYVNNERRFKLDEILKQFSADNVEDDVLDDEAVAEPEAKRSRPDGAA